MKMFGSQWFMIEFLHAHDSILLLQVFTNHNLKIKQTFDLFKVQLNIIKKELHV